MSGRRASYGLRYDFEMGATRRCCACGELREDVHNVVCLPVKAPIPGTGWGCVECGLPADGALALVCDSCALRPDDEQRAVEFAYNGPVGGPELVQVKWLTGQWQHDLTKHGGESA